MFKVTNGSALPLGAAGLGDAARWAAKTSPGEPSGEEESPLEPAGATHHGGVGIAVTPGTQEGASEGCSHRKVPAASSRSAPHLPPGDQPGDGHPREHLGVRHRPTQHPPSSPSRRPTIAHPSIHHRPHPTIAHPGTVPSWHAVASSAWRDAGGARRDAQPQPRRGTLRAAQQPSKTCQPPPVKRG